MRRFHSAAVSLLFALSSVSSNAQSAAGSRDSTEKIIHIGKLAFRDFNKNGKLDVYEDYRKSVEERAKDLLSKMTIQEKIVQLKSPWFQKAQLFTKNTFDKEKAARAFPIGLGEILQISHGNNVLVAKETPNSSQIAVLANDVQHYFISSTRLGIPVLFQEEALHGLMIKDGTMFPSALGMSSSWNDELTSEVFSAIATEARAVGTHRVLAPVLDLALDPRWGRTEETMGEDPYLTTRLGVAKVKALQGNSASPDSNHVASILKHFGAHGQPEGGVNMGPVFVSERWLREVNFKPFKAAVMEGKALGVMPNYYEISGIPTHANKWLLDDVLRKEWGFKGTVVSDLMAVAHLKTMHSIAATNKEAGADALNAGVYIELTLSNAMMDSLSFAVKAGNTSLETVNKAVLNVLEMKLRLGLFEHPYINVNHTKVVGSEAHRALALKAARQSMVLLKNDGNILPFDRRKYKKIAIIGPNADKCILGGYSQIPRTSVTPLQAIKEKFPDVEIVFAEGCKLTVGGNYGSVKLVPRNENIKLIQDAVMAAKDVDAIVLMLGGNDMISREATTPTSPGDLADLELLGKSGVIDHLIPDQTDHPKLFPKSECFRGHFCGNKVG
jgi:beta-glucosidase